MNDYSIKPDITEYYIFQNSTALKLFNHSYLTTLSTTERMRHKSTIYISDVKYKVFLFLYWLPYQG